MAVPIILQEWIKAVNRKNWTPTSSSYVCQLHFNDADFTITKHRRRLKPDVIPTRNLSNKSLENNMHFDICNIVPIMTTEETMTTESESTRTTEPTMTQIDEDSTQTVTIADNVILNARAEKRKMEPLERTNIKYIKLEEENKKLKDLIKSLTENYEEKLHNQADIFQNLIEEEKNAQKKKFAAEKQKFKYLQNKTNRIEKKLENVMQDLKTSKTLSNETYDILSSDISSVSSKIFENECKNEGKEKGRRYSEDIKRFALTLHYHSPKAYEFCRFAFFLLSQ